MVRPLCAGPTGQEGNDHRCGPPIGGTGHTTPKGGWHVNTATGSNAFDATQAGRKGIAYDWQSLFAASLAEQLDDQLLTLAPEYAD
jgi:hypothetical protein